MLVTLLLGLSTGFPIYYRIVYILALAFTGSFLESYLRIRGIEVKIYCDQSVVQVGDSVKHNITVRNKTRFAKPWLSAITSSPAHLSRKVFRLKSKEEYQFSIVAHPTNRGVYPLSPIELTASDLFGLFTHRRHFFSNQHLTVYPADTGKFCITSMGSGTSESTDLKFSNFLELPYTSGIRQYLPGDSFSRIHWPTSIRNRDLMTKELEKGSGRNVCLIVDLQEGVQFGTEGDRTDDMAAHVGASLARKYLSIGCPIGLLLSNWNSTYIPPTSGRGQHVQILKALTTTKCDGTTGLIHFLAQHRRQLIQFGSLVIITPSIDPTWVSSLTPFLVSGILISVMLINPESFGSSNSITHLTRELSENKLEFLIIRNGDSSIALSNSTANLTTNPETNPNNLKISA